MSNVLFNRDNLKVTGINRDPLAFEVAITNVNTEGLTKTVTYAEDEPKAQTVTNEDGTSEEKQLYLLPQPDQEIENLVEKTIKTSEDTGNPVMVEVKNQVPLLNEDGTQKQYEKTVRGLTTEDTGEPAMETVETEDGTTSEVQQTDDDQNLLYWGQIGTGTMIDCFTTEVLEQQEVIDGKLMFWDTETVNEPIIEEQPPLEITEDDDQWTEALNIAAESIQKERTASFSDEQGLFTYQDVTAHKTPQMIAGTFFDEAVLVEQMNEGVFDTALSTHQADVGFDFLSIPAGGEARTEKVTLPKASSLVGVVFDAHIDGLQVEVGRLASDLTPLDANGEVTLDQNATDVYVRFHNPTSKRIDLRSFALLV